MWKGPGAKCERDWWVGEVMSLSLAFALSSPSHSLSSITHLHSITFHCLSTHLYMLSLSLTIPFFLVYRQFISGNDEEKGRNKWSKNFQKIEKVSDKPKEREKNREKKSY